jgi:threonine dehydratase
LDRRLERIIFSAPFPPGLKVLVQEASIIAGMRMLLDHAGLVVEPSAALGIAAILEDRDRFAGRHVVTIVCGSNVDPDAYRRWVGAARTHGS